MFHNICWLSRTLNIILQNGENQIFAPGQFFFFKCTFHNDPLHLDLTHIMTVVLSLQLISG